MTMKGYNKTYRKQPLNPPKKKDHAPLAARINDRNAAKLKAANLKPKEKQP